ncbi:MAG: hypothetical protein DCC67_08855 [Planctomycetota bacterium]|nr:MAG: hypothetical protein DCC67_08855 [Planctomycetota bacterium]
MTLIAPRAWRRADAHRSTARRAAPKLDSPAHVPHADAHRLDLRLAPPTVAPEAAVEVPTLPPLAVAPLTAGDPPPMVLADDYVVVDEPLVEVAAAIEPTAADPAAEHVPPAEVEAVALRPPAQSVLVRRAAAPPVAERPLFNVDVLVQVRDALLAVVAEAPQRQAAVKVAPAEQPPPAATPVNPLRVRVTSPDDRLAMIPPPADASAASPWSALPREQPSSLALQPAPELADPLPASLSPAYVEPPAEPVLRRRPDALIAQLDGLSGVGPASEWAQQALIRIESLLEPAADEFDGPAVVEDLARLAEQGFHAALTVKDASEQTAWLRATRALDRRLPLWALLADRQYMQQTAGTAYAEDHAGLMPALQAVADLTADSAEGASWRQYLRLNDLAGLASIGGGDHAEQRRAAAREVLLRMEDPWLTKKQQAFLEQAPIAELARQLRPWASGEASLDVLAAIVERYESHGSQRDAAAIAELRMRLKWSDDSRLHVLADELDRHYRNANVRMAFTAELINRLIPPQPADVSPVHSRIAGTDVQGRSETHTDIYVRLLPDPRVWRFGLEARGKVSSQTRSLTWPARLRNSSRMEYEARKLVLVNRFGMHVWPAEARAEGNTSLVGVDSSFGYVPVLGTIIENAAREQHRLSRPRAIEQVKDKVREQACQRMDSEADVKLARLESQLRERVLEPIDRFHLAVEPLEMSTTDERATMRVRMANVQQLAAHTPRPSAPSDSLASFQLHQSAFNNALQGLELDGKRMTAIELRETLAQKFRRRAQPQPDDLPKAAKVEFAAYDAIRVACDGDRVELILNIKELRHGRDSIRGVGVHAFFRPLVDGLDVKLVRDGTLQFSGAHLRTGPRMVLHSVFGKLLPKDQEIPVLMAKLADDPRLDGMMITQLVIDDGWVAASLGPARADRVVWRTHGTERR